MKTIKELEADVTGYLSSVHSLDWTKDVLLGKIEALKDVLGLIDDFIMMFGNTPALAELKKRITG